MVTQFAASAGTIGAPVLTTRKRQRRPDGDSKGPLDTFTLIYTSQASQLQTLSINEQDSAEGEDTLAQTLHVEAGGAPIELPVPLEQIASFSVAPRQQMMVIGERGPQGSVHLLSSDPDVDTIEPFSFDLPELFAAVEGIQPAAGLVAVALHPTLPLLAILTDLPAFHLALYHVEARQLIALAETASDPQHPDAFDQLLWHPFLEDTLILTSTLGGTGALAVQWVQKLDTHALVAQTLTMRVPALELPHAPVTNGATLIKPYAALSTAFHPFDTKEIAVLTRDQEIALLHVENGNGKRLASLPSLECPPMIAIAYDSEGTLWGATKEGELCHFIAVQGEEAADALRIHRRIAIFDAKAETAINLSWCTPFLIVTGSKGSIALVHPKSSTPHLVVGGSTEVLPRYRGLLTELTARDPPSSQHAVQPAKAVEEQATTDEAMQVAPEEMDAAHQALYKELDRIRAAITTIIERNATAPELERLPASALILDLEEKDRLIKESQAKVQAVRSSIEDANMTMRILRDRMKTFCVDPFTVLPQTLFGLKTKDTTPVTLQNTAVHNFPMLQKDTAPHLAAKEEREAEIRRGEAVRRHGLAADVISIADAGTSELLLGELPQSIGDVATLNILYDTYQLTTQARRTRQVLLLETVVDSIKQAFNTKFQSGIANKVKEMAKIEDKNERIAILLKDLGLESEQLYRPLLDVREDTSKLLQVTDEEITVKKYISAEERQRQAEQARIEAERRAAAQGDNMRDRALNDMMGGTCTEAAEENVIVFKELPRPEWMSSKPLNEFTEEERKQIKEFEKKLNIHKEEQERHRKMLEAELRKLQEEIDGIGLSWNTQLKGLYEDRLLHEQAILFYELMIARLNQTSYLEDSEETKKPILVEKIRFAEAAHNEAMQEIPSFRDLLNQSQDEYDAAVRADKDAEKQFRKHFTELDERFLLLNKLFRTRTLPLPKELYTSRPQSAQNAFASNVSKASEDVEDLPPIDELDRERDFPYDMEEDRWVKLIELRQRKLEGESALHQKGRLLSERDEVVQRLSKIAERKGHQLEANLQEWEHWNADSATRKHDLEGVLKVKQGQVEVRQSSVVPDYTKCSLIDRADVEKLNARIKVLGDAKVEALKEIKEYRKGIHALEWQAKVLDFQAESEMLRIRDIQLLRVTKDMQDFIRRGVDDTNHAATNAMLEKRLEHTAQAHQHKLAEKKRQIEHWQNETARMQAKSHHLEAEASLLQAEIAGRQATVSTLNMAPGHARERQAEADGEEESALAVLQSRRKYKELTASQATEIAKLKKELERLQERSVPIFRDVYRD